MKKNKINQFNDKMTKKLKKDLDKVFNDIEELSDKIKLRNKFLTNVFNKETETHSHRVAQLAMFTGISLDLKSKEIFELVTGAFLHDIGKVRIPNEILNKPEKLTKNELIVIKAHPSIGYELVKDYELSTNITDIILEHHEHLDGSGYPYNKTDKEINPLSKIISVCDVYEAFSSKRCYKDAEESEIVMQFIIDNKNTKFDSSIVDIFYEKVYPILRG